jgi:hypothetical protein
MPTMHELFNWMDKEKECVGHAVLCAAWGKPEKLGHVIQSLNKLSLKAESKIDTIIEDDRKNELKLLAKHAKKLAIILSKLVELIPPTGFQLGGKKRGSTKKSSSKKSSSKKSSSKKSSSKKMSKRCSNEKW